MVALPADNNTLLTGEERDAYIAKRFNQEPIVQEQTIQRTAADWYDNLKEQDQELYDMIEDRCPEFSKLNGELCREFMDLLSEYGITTAEQFEDAFFTSFSYALDESHFGEFVEYIVTEIDCQPDLPEFLVIDWEASWYRNYRHDFFTIEFDGEVYFFRNNF